MRNTLLPLALAGLLTTTGLACAQTATAPDSGIKPLGSVVLPSQLSIDGIPFGGISGLDYNPATQTFVAISDDKSEMAPARFYTLGMDLTSKGFTGLNIRAVHELRQPDGTLFPVSGTDSESIRFAPGGGLVWSSERDQKNAPHVYTATADGKETGTYPVPAYYAPNADMTQGAYPNVSFEGISFTPDRSELIVSTENGLMQDGPKATLKQGSPSRFLAFDAKSHKLLWERIYMTDPIPHAPAKEGGHADNGISEILALGPDRYLVMERSWSQGVGDDIRIYLATTQGATEVTGQAHVDLSQVTPMTKTLLLTLEPKSVGLQWIDNIECMTFGPRVDGHRTLILASDNNFSDDEQTQFIAYELPDSLN